MDPYKHLKVSRVKGCLYIRIPGYWQSAKGCWATKGRGRGNEGSVGGVKMWAGQVC